MKSSILKIISIQLLVLSSLFAAVFDISYLQGRRDLLQAYDLIYKTYADSLDADELMQAGVKGLTDALDKYTFHLSNSSRFDFDLLSNGQYGGVGMTISQQNDTIHVVELTPGGPSENIGVLPDDRLISVDDISLVGKSSDETAKLLRGRPNTDATLTIRRETGEEFHRIIIRKEIKVKSIQLVEMIAPGVLYISLDRFTRHLARDLQTELTFYQRNYSLSSVIIDLRDNGGGMLDEAVGLLDLFLPQGEKVLETRSVRPEKNRVYYTKKDPVVADSVRVCLLINNGSASASEIVAGAMQDLDRAVIVGTASHGKGLVQNIIRISKEHSIKLTTSKYYIPSGRLIQKEKYLKNNDVILDPKKGASQFFTSRGRPVKESGGIEPDTLVKGKIVAAVVSDLKKKKLLFKYVRYVGVYHPGSNIWSSSQMLWEDFQAYLEKVNYQYKNPLRVSLDSLKKELDSAGYLNKLAEVNLNHMEQKVAQGDKLENYKNDIISLLKIEKLRFYKGNAAALSESLMYDDCLSTTVTLCGDNRYATLLKTP